MPYWNNITMRRDSTCDCCSSWRSASEEGPMSQQSRASTNPLLAPAKWFQSSEIRHNANIFHKNREVSILTMKKNSKVNTSSESHRKNQTRKDRTKDTNRYEQKCQSHTCSGTINSSIYDSDLTTTTSPLTSSELPTVGKGQWHAKNNRSKHLGHAQCEMHIATTE
jgi:hypothetical protein